MQEVQVQPRDIYLHYIHVNKPGKSILWWFSTKKKNISFGLYQRKPATALESILHPIDTQIPYSQAIPINVPVHPNSPIPAASTSTSRPNTSQPSTPSNTHFFPSHSPTMSHSFTSTFPAFVRKGSRNSIQSLGSIDFNLPRISVETDDESMHEYFEQGQNPTSGGPSMSPGPFPTPGSGSTGAKSRRKSNAAIKLKDPSLVEVVPLEHHSSSTNTIKGSFLVEEPGTYALVFDNSYSRTTAKLLTFFVAVKDLSETNDQLQPDISGWLLKKKRVKMQGWAKRWFQMTNGVLTYSLEPNAISRGSLQVRLSTISVSPQHRTMHIDSGTTLFHLKAYTTEEFDAWLAAIRQAKTSSFSGTTNGLLSVGVGLGAVERSPRISNERKADGLAEREDEDEDEEPRIKSQLARLYEGLGNIDVEFKNVRDLLELLREQVDGMSGSKLGKEKERNMSMDAMGPTATGRFRLPFKKPSPSGAAAVVAGSLLGKSAAANGSPSPSSSTPQSSSPAPDSSSNASAPSTPTIPNNAGLQRSPIMNSAFPIELLSEKLHATFWKLKSEKEHLVEYLRSEVEYWHFVEATNKRLFIENAELKRQLSQATQPTLNLPDANLSVITTISDDPAKLTPHDGEPSTSTITINFDRNHQRNSYAASFTSFRTSNHSDIFYDAEEIVLTEDEEEDDGESDDELISNSLGISSIRVLEPETLESSTQSTVVDNTQTLESNSTTPSLETSSSPADDPLSSSLASTTSSTLLSALQLVIPHRRSRLPSPVCGDDISLFSLLRKNVGKDLSTIAMPISLNEPLNLLQRLAEELEYSELLDRANSAQDSIERLLLVTTFAISGYASTQYRASRKPFNPLHGETYECVRPDKGFRFIAEKVNHQPPIMACHAESANFVFCQDSMVKSKFWGKSMELIPYGTVHVDLPATREHFTWNKPSTWMRNMIAGNRYLEHCGEMRVTNHTTGEYALVTFKEATGGLFTAAVNRNEVVAILYSRDGHKMRTIIGRWSSNLLEEIGKDKYETVWRAEQPPADQETYYGFTKLATELNEITELEKDKLPKTDTRYRPDQRLFERGEVSEAEAEKLRVEQRQREYRKRLEAAGKAWETMWFEKRPDPYAAAEGGAVKESWQYKGGYWEARESGAWPEKMLELW